MAHFQAFHLVGNFYSFLDYVLTFKGHNQPLLLLDFDCLVYYFTVVIIIIVINETLRMLMISF